MIIDTQINCYFRKHEHNSMLCLSQLIPRGKNVVDFFFHSLGTHCTQKLDSKITAHSVLQQTLAIQKHLLVTICLSYFAQIELAEKIVVMCHKNFY